MEFRPCIDIHNGKVKQIVGGSLRDQGNYARENFISEKPAEYYADLYRRDGLRGGHVILLNSRDSEYYEKTRQEACSALAAFPQGMQVGGGIRDDNAEAFLDAGAYAVIVTSFVFSGGEILSRNLDRLVRSVGQDHIVLDLSCRARDGSFYIVTDRWQKFTDLELTPKLLMELSSSCAEFLIHAADVEGQQNGIDEEVTKILASYTQKEDALPTTYAGGIRSLEDIEKLKNIGNNRVNYTVGSALNLFGGSLDYEELLGMQK